MISNLGWWSLSGEQLLAMLRRVDQGEDPEAVYIEAYANCDRSDRHDRNE